MDFVQSELECNSEGNEDRVNGVMLELWSLLHCDLCEWDVPQFFFHLLNSLLPPSAARCTVFENGLTRQTLVENNGKALEGRNLNEKALLVIATLKFAHKSQKECCIANGDNPSGNKVEDVLLFVRRKCHVPFHGKKNEKLAKKRAGEDFAGEDTPLDCFFAEHFTFVLCRPQAVSGMELECIAADDHGVKKKSCAQARKEEAAAKQAERECGVNVTGCTPSDFAHGVNTRDKVSAAQIAHSELREAKQNVHEPLIICNEDHKMALKEIDLLGKMIERGEENGVDATDLGRRMSELFDSLKGTSARKEELRLESSQLRKDGNSKRPMEALHSQVALVDNSTSKALEMTGSATPAKQKIFNYSSLSFA